MRIAIDARTYSWTGIGRYTRNVLRALATVPTRHEFIVLLTRQDEEKYTLPFPVVYVEPSYYSLREQTIFLRQLWQVNADIVHFTHFNIPLLYRRPYVVTIHDVTRFLFPGQRQVTAWQQIAYETVFRHAVKQAAAVIAVSQTTAQDIARLPLKLTAPLSVIYEGVEQAFRQPVAESSRRAIRELLHTEDPYFLFVGVWMSHKNVARLLRAFRLVLAAYPATKLVITGKWQTGYVPVDKLVREYGLEKAVILPGFVPHELLPALYAQALAFVFPSLYEGFGLPPLEAASLGTPVITSNVSSLPEIMGAGALYVNPESVESIRDALLLVASGSEKVKCCVAAGQIRASQFRWEETAQQTIAVYDKLVV